MPHVWKDILKPGTYRLDDDRVVSFDESSCREIVRNGNAMLSEGTNQHPKHTQHTSGVPYAGTNELATHQFGDVVRFAFHSGRVWGLFDADDEYVGKLKRVRMVSPRLDLDWTDERGKVWTGLSALHVAATPQPIQRNQGSFLFSHAGRRDVRRSRAVYFLSHMPMEGEMADENKDEKKDEKKEGEDTGGTPPVSPPPPTPPADSNRGVVMASILNSLAALGVPLPTDGSIKGMEELDAALKVASAIRADVVVDDDSPDANRVDEVSGGMPPIIMSHWNKIGAASKKDLGRRVNELFATGRIDGPLRDKLLGKLKTVELSHKSFDARGELKSIGIVEQIKAYEDLPKGKFDVNMSHHPVIVPPTGPAGLQQGGSVSDRGRNDDEAVQVAEETRKRVEAANKAYKR